MPVREQPGQHELERLSLADHGALDLVEDLSRELVNALELHHRRSSDSTTRPSSAGLGATLEPVLGLGPTLADELPRLLSERASGRVGIAVEIDPPADREQLDREVAQPRPQAVVELERPGDAERDVVLDAREARR